MEKNRDSMMQTLKFEVLHMEKKNLQKQGKDRSADVRGIAENHQGICKRDNGIGGQVYEV